MFFIDVYKMTFRLWKDQLGDFIIPALEMYVISMAANLVIGLLVATTYIILFVTGVIWFSTVTMVIIAMGVNFMTGCCLIPVYAVKFGGVAAVYKKAIDGEKPRFLDVVRNGFKRFGTNALISFAEIMATFGIMVVLYVPVIVIQLLAFSWLLMVVLLLVVIVVALLTLLFIGFFYCLFRMPHVASVHEDAGAGTSLARGMGLVLKNTRGFLALGITFIICYLVLAMVPVIGMLSGIIAFPFFMSLMEVAYRKLNNLYPFAPPPGDSEMMMSLYFYGTGQEGPPKYEHIPPPIIK